MGKSRGKNSPVKSQRPLRPDNITTRNGKGTQIWGGNDIKNAFLVELGPHGPVTNTQLCVHLKIHPMDSSDDGQPQSCGLVN